MRKMMWICAGWVATAGLAWAVVEFRDSLVPTAADGKPATIYRYDSRGNLVEVITPVDADGKKATYQYDKTEHFDHVTDADGLVRTYTYDTND